MTDTVALSQLPAGQAIAPASGNLTLDGTKIGSVTPQTGSFTTVSASTPIGGQSGGTNSAFMQFAGPASAVKTYTLPNATTTILTTNTAVTVAQGGTGVATLTANSVLVGNGTGNVGGVAPGSSGNVLTSNGTNWASSPAAGGGGSVYTNGYFTNNYYFGSFGYYNFTGFAVSANILYCTPFMVRSSATFTRIGVNVITTGVGTAGRLGIYNIVNGYPTTLVLDASTVSLGTTGIKEITISQTLSAGIYAMVFIADGAATMLSAKVGTAGTDSASTMDMWGVTSANYTGGGTISGYVHALTYGALPGTFPSSSPAQSDTNNVLLSMRVV